MTKIKTRFVGLLTQCMVDENSKKIIFSHNPFSMPQGKLEDLNFDKPLDIKAYQYDIICNGISYPLVQLEIIFLVHV